MGADSWQEITTWREWEKVLTAVNIIVVTRPKYEIGFSHVTDEIRERIVDLRGEREKGRKGEREIPNAENQLPITNHQSPIMNHESRIYITDAVQMDISATRIRKMVRENKTGWKEFVPEEVAGHIEKYEMY